MQSKGNAPTKAQKDWREAVRTLGSSGINGWSDTEIHHPVGVTAKHNKVHIGHWWVIAMPKELHMKLHAGGLGHNRKEFEKRSFKEVLEFLPESVKRPPLEAIEAIRDYHR